MLTLILIGIAAAVATTLGGLLALRLNDRLHLITGFSAGAVIGVAFFDLMPEAFDMGSSDIPLTASVIAAGFLLYMVIDRLLTLHAGEEHAHGRRSTVGTLSLSIHSFLDGIGIGFAFQVSNALGVVVTLAVLAHDFSDGINTVNMSLLGSTSKWRAGRWLFVNALAPILGIAVTFLFSITESTLGLLIALFTGFFLYIGAAELVPESHHRHPHIWTTIMTIAGAALLYFVINIGL